MAFEVAGGGVHAAYYPAEQEAKSLGTEVWYVGVRGQSCKVWPLEVLSTPDAPVSKLPARIREQPLRDVSDVPPGRYL